jgi:hypothetical protein
MRKIFLIGLASLAVGLTAAGAASAQTPPDVNTPAAKAGPASIDWPIGDLIANDATKAVLQKDLPALLSYDGLDMIKGMSLRNISQYPQAELDDKKLAVLQADLAATGVK